MEKEVILKSLNELKSTAKKRNFEQSIDLIINLKDLDLKNPAHQIEFFMTLPHHPGKKKKICALVGNELKEDARKYCDKVVSQEEFSEYAKDKKKTKKLASECDFFIAQANIMAQVAAAFGKVLGPRGKMPNPKAGCVISPKESLKTLCEKLQKTVRISAKTTPLIQCLVGKESLKEEEVAENILEILSQLESKLPQGKNNIKNVYIKLTMSKPVKVM